MLILVFAYLMLECIIAYQIFNSAFAKQMLRCIVNLSNVYLWHSLSNVNVYMYLPYDHL